MKKSNSYRKTIKKKKAGLFAKTKNNVLLCLSKIQTFFQVSYRNLKEMTSKTLTQTKCYFSRVRIVTAAFILGLNKYQLSYALMKLVEAPIYVPEKIKGYKNANVCCRKSNCNK